MILSFEFISAYLGPTPPPSRAPPSSKYALLVALIAVVCIAAVTALGKKAKSN
jgi:hypothetical protein